jgi:frataxin-like iron-binding protein CyaY
MEMAEYLNRADELFRIVEDKLEEFEEDVDYDKTDGKIEIQFEWQQSPCDQHAARHP